MLSSSDIHTNNNMSTLGSGGRGGGGGGGGVYQQYFRSEFLDDSDSEMTTKSRQESLAEPAAGIRASEDEEDDLIVASIEDQWGPSFLGDVVEPSAAPQEVKVGEKRQEQYAPSAGGYLNEYDEDDDEEQGKKKGLGDILGDTMFIGTMPTATSEASFDNGETGKSYQGDMTKEGTEAKSNKRRNCLIWILSLGLLFGIILIVLGTTLGLKNRKENSSTTTDSDSASSKECFQTTQELYNAVDTYFEGSASSTSQQDLESQYGFPMNEWCVGNLTSFDFVFSAARNPDVVSMNEPLDKWDMSNAQSLEGMFLGASAFNQDISTWKTFSVRTFKAMFRDATEFNQPLGDWDVSAAVDFSAMFYNATNFDQNLCSWAQQIDPFARVWTMFFEASSCPAIAAAPNLELGGPFCAQCPVTVTIPGVEIPTEINISTGTASNGTA